MVQYRTGQSKPGGQGKKKDASKADHDNLDSSFMVSIYLSVCLGYTDNVECL